MQGNTTQDTESAGYDREARKAQEAEEARKAEEARTQVQSTLAASETTDAGLPPPPDFARQPTSVPPPRVIAGIPKAETVEPGFEDEITQVRRAPQRVQAGDEVISRTAIIGEGRVIRPEEQRLESLEYVESRFPVGSVIRCDFERGVPDDENLSYGVVRDFGRDEKGILVELVWVNSKGQIKRGNFSARRLLKINKGTRDVVRGMVKDITKNTEIVDALKGFFPPNPS